MHRRIKILVVSCAAIILIIAASVVTLAPKLVWNASKSAPIGLYLIVQRTPQLGEFTLVTPSEPVAELIRTRGYLPPDIPLIKRVSAVAGDEICRENQSIFINKKPVAQAQLVDSSGREMPQWSGCFTLQSQEIFLLNAHEQSLDGRYFGATKLDDVIGVAIPVWMRG